MGAPPFTSPSWPPYTQQLPIFSSFAQFISKKFTGYSIVPTAHPVGAKGVTHGPWSQLPNSPKDRERWAGGGKPLTWQPDFPICTAKYSLTCYRVPTTIFIPHPVPECSFILSAHSQASSWNCPQAEAPYFNHSLPYGFPVPNNYNL